MAVGQSDLSLLFKLKAQNEASPAIKSAQADIAKLTSTTSAQFGQMQKITTQSLGAVTQSLTQVGSQLPIVGGAVSSLSSSLGSLTSTAATSAGSVGLIAGAAVVAASALGGTLKAIFDITVAAAEFQGKLFDTSQQLGISVETLSTLEIVAKTTGGTIEGITASLGIFQKKLEDALDPTSKESALLQTLGIDTNNTEEALRQALTVLSQMPEGFRQTATALELFGRGGKSILAILKEMGGDLDGATEKFRAMGILISTDAAKAADKFNDQLALLGFQIRSVTAIIGNEAMPTILSALTDISKAFQDNQTAIIAWVNSTADAARGALILADAVRAIGTQITGLSNLPVPGILRLLGSVSGVSGILTGLQKLGTPEIGALKVPDLATPLRESTATPGSVIDLGKGKKGLTEAQKNAKAELQILELKAQDAARIYQLETAGLQQQFDQRKIALREYTKQLEEAAGKELAARQRVTDEEKRQAEILPARQKKVELAKIALREAQDQDAYILAGARAQEAQRKAEEQGETKHQQALLNIGQVHDAARIAQIQEFASRESISRLDAQKQIEAIQKAAFEREQAELLRRLRLVKGNQEEEDAITDALNRNSAARAAQEQENQRLTTKAVREGAEAYREYRDTLAAVAFEITTINRAIIQTELNRIGLFAGTSGRVQIIQREAALERDALQDAYQKRKAAIDKAEYDERQKHIGDEQKLLEIEKYYHALRLAEEQQFQSDKAAIERDAERAKALAGPGGGFVAGLDSGQLVELANGVQSFADVATVAFSAVGAVVNQLAQGVGNLVQQWVLLGSVGPNAFKKLVASVLAGVAAQAATLAIMELAYGIAALTPWGAAVYGPAPFHFKAAALFAAVAVTAGLAGRAVAGSAFQSTAGGGGTGEGSAGPGQLNPLTLPRNQPQQPQTQRIVIEVKDSEFGKAITAHVVRDITEAGPIRETIANDGAR